MNTHFEHVTSEAALSSIRTEGLRPGSYWSALDDLTAYYAETVEDEGNTSVVLRVPTSALHPSHRRPDRPGLEEPIMTVVRAFSGAADEDEVWRRWTETAQTADACLALIGSLHYQEKVPPKALEIQTPSGAWEPLRSPAPEQSHPPENSRPPRLR